LHGLALVSEESGKAAKQQDDINESEEEDEETIDVEKEI
jgi:hypothetical protein